MLPQPGRRIDSAATRKRRDLLMKKAQERLFTAIVLAAVCFLSAGIPGRTPDALAQERGAPITLLGIGASFPAPLYEKWFKRVQPAAP